MPRKRSSDDKPVLWMVRQPQGLVPASQFDAEMIERYAMGARVIVTIDQPKDEAQERLYRAVVSKVAKGIGVTHDSLHWTLRLKAGLYRSFTTFDGAEQIEPLSTKDLDQSQFNEFVTRAFEIITTEICPGATTEEILDGVWTYAGMPEVPL